MPKILPMTIPAIAPEEILELELDEEVAEEGEGDDEELGPTVI
jgi:hypothetical protein